MGFIVKSWIDKLQNRYEMAIDEDYYDNIQWDDESAAILRQRGQALWFITSSQRQFVWCVRYRTSSKSLITRFYRDAKEESDSAEKEKQR